VLDAGTTDSGRPYFVMELVKGVPITKYCDEKLLPLRARLELFVQVCQAVQHAHQKGIIHRDIKPNNVLVAEYDNRPVPKVIDFGVAKATAQRLTERTMFTEFGQVFGTMEYMSPEQSKFNQLDIDTRSDIYSLGVLLYELLAGSTPFEGKRLQEAAFDEMLRIIREEEPPKPSTRISSIDTLPSVAANRHTEPARLSKDVRGELDWIVMKALEKDRNRRYETASGFAADIERHLNDQPVEAGPPSAAYRFRKFARRNKAAIAVAGLVLFFLVLLGIGAGWAVRDRAAREAELARERTERQAKVASQVESILNELARLEKEQKIGKKADAEKAYREAIAIREKLAGYGDDYSSLPAAGLIPGVRPDYRSLLNSDYASLGELLQGSGKLGNAEEAYRKALKISEDLTAEFPTKSYYWRQYYASLHRLRRLLAETGRPQDAEQTMRLAIVRLEELATEFPVVAEIRAQLTDCYVELARLLKGVQPREAEKAYRQAIPLLEKLEADFPDQRYLAALANGYTQLAVVLSATGRSQEAEKAFRSTLELKPDSAVAMNNLAWILATCPEPKFRDVDRALELAKKAVELAPHVGVYWSTLGIAECRAGNWESALAALEQSIELGVQLDKPSNPQSALQAALADSIELGGQGGATHFFLAMIHWRLGNKDEARKWYDKAAQWMETRKLWQLDVEQLRSFRAEAEELLKITDEKPTAKPPDEVK
jgi:tetratricopeptide (TPR) repeat protein